eukprot:g34801.t1
MGKDATFFQQKLKRKDPSQKEVQCWSKAVEDRLWDCLESVDWTVFKYSAENLHGYPITVTDFISKHTEDCVPKKLIRVFRNHKPWMNQEIHSLLKSRRAAFKSGDPDQCKKSGDDLCKTIREAERQYRIKLEAQ